LAFDNYKENKMTGSDHRSNCVDSFGANRHSELACWPTAHGQTTFEAKAQVGGKVEGRAIDTQGLPVTGIPRPAVP
jgi:hypothetical protein